MSVLAVDVGTSMIKTVVLDDEGTEVAVARQATSVQRPRPGWAEQDMTAVWEAVVTTIRSARRHVVDNVRFIAFTAQGDGCWLVDDKGDPTGPAILWSDGRAAPVVEGWRASGILDEAFRRTGSLTFPGLPNAILAWLAAHDPDRLARSSTSLYCGGWLFLRFTGLTAVDESDASAPFLDPRTRRYSPEIRTLFGLDWAEQLLPPVRGNGHRVGDLTARTAAELGLPAGLPVVMAPYDIVSTATGVGATAPGQACTILGTTLCTEVVRERPDTTGEPAGLTIVQDSHGRLLRAFPTLAGTEVITWAVRTLGLDTPAELGELAVQSPPGARGLVFLPYLSPAGERAPFLDPHARGTFWGMSLDHQPCDVARAVLEGLTMVIRDCLTASSAATDELRLCGGGAASDAWCRLIADVTGLRTVRSADSEVGAKGAFLSGLVSLGAEPDITTAAHRYVRIRAADEPDEERSRFYASHFDTFLTLRDLSATGWRILAGSPATPDTSLSPAATTPPATTTSAGDQNG
ncbi:carbohydrate kinase [Streptomyces pluripotens]|uniref:Carbohydrate kinase n=1 Tax=Streptomyces pluripotens TaxID=1355015 RepID=A0A221P786_9ACTN|nr:MULTISPECIES: FGGY-family carbohydrate kinase [Streptomyces]ARP73738.1 carbohydrate kinase [Streptomyces pluripotens]ASN27984.1 carbohydrate kinase [Streptomyces pluripotens]MCH0559305.1 carbohydrate kinase [Streptomyces sp. MUM 16J]